MIKPIFDCLDCDGAGYRVCDHCGGSGRSKLHHSLRCPARCDGDEVRCQCDCDDTSPLILEDDGE